MVATCTSSKTPPLQRKKRIRRRRLISVKAPGGRRSDASPALRGPAALKISFLCRSKTQRASASKVVTAGARLSRAQRVSGFATKAAISSQKV